MLVFCQPQLAKLTLPCNDVTLEFLRNPTRDLETGTDRRTDSETNYSSRQRIGSCVLFLDVLDLLSALPITSDFILRP
jgi:hypothetical protein